MKFVSLMCDIGRISWSFGRISNSQMSNQRNSKYGKQICKNARYRKLGRELLVWVQKLRKHYKIPNGKGGESSSLASFVQRE